MGDVITFPAGRMRLPDEGSPEAARLDQIAATVRAGTGCTAERADFVAARVMRAHRGGGNRMRRAVDVPERGDEQTLSHFVRCVIGPALESLFPAGGHFPTVRAEVRDDAEHGRVVSIIVDDDRL
ncbi:hypothetical protein RHODGE_RHODGE_03990 [Rhodoplanes serenus]|uniref:Uncharacterized protein n=1 Tax=Rhodoplanes serenus TaxID=200615 RepID=A0A447CZR0_9BRAD|nr:hypothetical protein [Rhodoplanes serenus]VCU10786.1 hypothetical protein RHODGE_RHODGE_03990 [Rhodoplanes serenus]